MPTGTASLRAYTIDDGFRTAICIAEDNAPWDVCLFREHRRNLSSSTFRARHESELKGTAGGPTARATAGSPLLPRRVGRLGKKRASKLNLDGIPTSALYLIGVHVRIPLLAGFGRALMEALAPVFTLPSRTTKVCRLLAQQFGRQ
jgi:hypothetical protein